MLDVLNIENMIYNVNGKEVMLDRDLAMLYGCTNGTKTINQAVKRHLERFPSDFCFKVSIEEANRLLRSQNETLNQRGQNLKYEPRFFTEQGVAMLASVLKTENASKVSIQIMRTFVKMRHILSQKDNLLNSIINIKEKQEEQEKLLRNHEIRIEELFNKFKKDCFKECVFYEGEVYESYSKLIDILKESKKEVIIVDNYADKSALDLIKNIKSKVIIINKPCGLLSSKVVEKYNMEYNNLKVIESKNFHDRFIIIDRNKVYHLGASLNTYGNKVCAINRITEESVRNKIIEVVTNIISKEN